MIFERMPLNSMRLAVSEGVILWQLRPKFGLFPIWDGLPPSPSFRQSRLLLIDRAAFNGGLTEKREAQFGAIVSGKCLLAFPLLIPRAYRRVYRAEKKSSYVVARVFQASWGRSDKQQQEQTSPNHIQRNFLSSVIRAQYVFHVQVHSERDST